MSLPSTYFYFGICFSVLLALGASLISLVPNGEPLRIVLLISLAQTHILIGYVFYFDIVRTRVTSKSKFVMLLGGFLGVVVLYYFSRYVWTSVLVVIIPLLTMLYFILHHTLDLFYFKEKFERESFSQTLKELKYWLIGLATSFFGLSLSYTWIFFFRTQGHSPRLLVTGIFFIFCTLFFFLLIGIYKRAPHYRRWLVISTPLAFGGPILFHFISFNDFKIFIIFWRVLLWLVMYPLLLHFRNKNGIARKTIPDTHSFISSFIRKTKASVRNFLAFYVVVNVLMACLFVLTAHLIGAPLLSDTMVYNNIFWGFLYFDLWTFAHVTFSFFPKEV